MSIKIKPKKAGEILLLALLFFAAMNFGAKFFYFVFLSFFAILAMKRSLEVDTASVIYLILCVVMAIYHLPKGLLAILRCFAPFCFYLVGNNMVLGYSAEASKMQDQNNVQKRGFSILVVIALGSFSHYLLNYLYNLGSSLERNTNDIWTGQIMAATAQNALTCLMLGLSCAMLFLPPRKWHRWASALIIVLILEYNLVLSCRTLLVILGVLLLVGMLYPKQNTQYGMQLLKYLACFALLCGVVMVFYAFNIGGFRESIQNSLLFSRFDGSTAWLTDNESRSDAKLAFLSQMGNYPFGGCHMRRMYGYAHDLLLDGYDEYGVVVFLLLIVVLIISVVQLYTLLRKTNYSESFKLSLLLIYCAVFLEFTVEPILEGMPWLFPCFCLLNGCTTGMNRAYFRYYDKERIEN